MLDLESEIQWFNTQWGNILLVDIFCFYIVKPLMPILALLSISFNYEKPRLMQIVPLVVKTMCSNTEPLCRIFTFKPIWLGYMY